MNRREWKKCFDELPFIDSHCHVMPQKVGETAFGNRPFRGASPLAGLLLGYGSLLCFMAAGIQREEVDGIKDGKFSKEESRDIILRYLPFAETSPPVAYCKRGLELLAGEEIESIHIGNWEFLESLLTGDAYSQMNVFMKRQNIPKAVQNMWAGWGVSYYGRYWDACTEKEKAADQNAFVSLATFDSYAVQPFTDITREYARLVGGDAESFHSYDCLLDSLADFFVSKRGVRGFKISECYFRPLDYQPVSYNKAEKCFRENPSQEERQILSNYVTWRVLELAREYQVPVQIHTGELWGDTAIQQVNPFYLEKTLRAFPDVTFDLLHCGYPFVKEMGILGANFRNVILNLSYMPLRSLTMFRNCLELYSNIASSDRLLLGTDVFDPACMAGCIDFMRLSCAHLASEMEELRIASQPAIIRLFRQAFSQTAQRLYRIEY